jgi:hypothetical protein
MLANPCPNPLACCVESNQNGFDVQVQQVQTHVSSVPWDFIQKHQVVYVIEVTSLFFTMCVSKWQASDLKYAITSGTHCDISFPYWPSLSFLKLLLQRRTAQKEHAGSFLRF